MFGKKILPLCIFLLFANMAFAEETTLLEILADSPSEGQSFLRGDTVIVKAHVFVDSEITLSLDSISSYGFFGSISLYDDGDHNDDKWRDGYFANTFTISPEQDSGIFSVFVSARQSTNYMLKKVSIIISPNLDAKLETDLPAYYLGDEIVFSGRIKRHSEPVEKDFEIIVKDAAGKEYRVKTGSAEDGNFSAVFHTSLIDSPGKWTASFAVYDDLNNLASDEKEFEVKNPEDRSFLDIELIGEPLLFYKRGSDLLLLARVFDDLGSPVTEAQLELETPLGEKHAFEKSDENIFFVALRIPVSMPKGNQNFFVRAKSGGSEGIKSGDLNFSLNIREIGMRIELLSPRITQASVGDTVFFSARIFYENGEPLSARFVPATVNSSTIVLSHEGGGIYSAPYIVRPEDTAINFSIDFSDEFQNHGLFSSQINVEGTSIIYYFREYYYCFLAGFAVVLVAGWLMRKRIKEKMELRSLRKQLKSAQALLEKADKEYIGGNIPRAEYNKLTAKYQGEIVRIENRIITMEAKKNARK